MQINNRIVIKAMKQLLATAALIMSFASCSKNVIPKPVLTPEPVAPADTLSYPGVPQSGIYSVSVIQGNETKKLAVFQNICPEYQAGYMNMTTNDQFPLNIFRGRSINWAEFSFSGTVTIEVKVLDQTKVALSSTVKILPSRYGITPTVDGNTIRFTLTNPGQVSVEIGDEGYKNGLVLFADPPETDIPDTSSGNFMVLRNTTASEIGAVPAQYSGIYFKSGVHDIGVYHVPANIKNIYFEAGSWVYGALIMNGNPNVKIWGRGVLSSAKLDYRESHCIEAINGSDNTTIEGIVLADTKYFSIRLINTGDKVDWVKVIGGWTYNTDGIRVGDNSSVSHCFVWANDDNIKVYRNNITYSDMVCWQLNNGGVIQLSWGNTNATNVTISRVDVLHAEWNTDASNRGVISCVGDKFAEGGMFGLQKNFLIDDLVTETPVPIVFNIQPNPASPNEIHGMTFKDWNIKMDMSKGYNNYMICSDPNKKYDGLVFDNFIFNGTKLTESNWISTGRFQVSNVETPEFK
jgi:hypothetical protein